MQIPPFQLERFFAKFEFAAPYLLCASDCESVSIRELLKLSLDAENELKRVWLGYTESSGSPQLRQAIAGLYQQIAPEQVLVHAGAEEAIFIFMHAALTRGDHIIVHDPCYQSLQEIARTIGCRVTKWPAQEADHWELDLRFLRKHLRKATKAIVVNCPHNPTGYLMGPEKFQQLVEFARAHNLLLFSDEVYQGLEYDPHDRLPSACDLYERAVSLGVMSKTYGLGGLRIGWVATRCQQLLQQMAAFKDYTSICNSAPSEFLATLALQHRDKLVQRNREIIINNLHRLNRFFYDYRHLFTWVAPKAGPIAFPRVNLEIDAEAFCLDLVEKQGVLLLPGNYYDVGNRHFRIGFGRKNLPDGLQRFETYLQERFPA